MHSCDTGRILAFVIRIRLIILLCTGLNRTGIALPASSSLREREIAFRHRPNTSSGRRGVFSHMIHRSNRRFRVWSLMWSFLEPKAEGAGRHVSRRKS